MIGALHLKVGVIDFFSILNNYSNKYLGITKNRLNRLFSFH